MPSRRINLLRRRNARKTPLQGTSVPRFPGLFQSTLDSTHSFRFLSVQSGPLRAVTISRLGLINILGSGIAPNLSFSMLDAIRVIGIKIWTVSGPVGAPVGAESVTLRWTSQLGKSNVMIATGNAFAPATIQSRPPRNSLASFWTRRGSPATTAAEIIFEMVLPAGSIIDIHVEIELQNGGPFPVPIALASPATNGALSVVNLDNNGGNSPSPTDFLACQGYVSVLSAT